MTLARMTDRSLPLAERVAEMVGLFRLWPKGYPEASDELLADIAAADELARAGVREQLAYDLDDGDPERVLAYKGMMAALATYRDRMAQGVGDAG